VAVSVLAEYSVSLFKTTIHFYARDYSMYRHIRGNLHIINPTSPFRTQW